MAEITAAELAGLIGADLSGEGSVVLGGVTHDSRRAKPGSLFCCVVGDRHDGHDFAADAVGAGASALLCSRVLALDVPQLVVADVRAAMGPAAAAVHGYPSRSLAVVGVTGTNGKTTVVTMLADVLRRAGLRCEVIGTLTGERTTPEAPELQSRFAQWLAEGVTHVAMEVSSHALSLHRVDGTTFRVAVFTNLGEDHLDFHRTPEAYFAAKATLFEPDRSESAVVNVDDVRGRLLRDAARIPMVGYSTSELEDLELRSDGSRFAWRGEQVELPLPGRYNVSNALAVAETASLLGVDDRTIASALTAGTAVPGRFELVEAGQDATVVVDYAHTPDALHNVLGAARELVAPAGRLLVVFGCGGDRDAAKRPAMGRVATRAADVAVLTNDNPRSEDPLRIIEQIRSGCVHDPLVVPDRRAAIRHAIAESRGGDVVVIAGKGHEQGQQFADREEPFDDRVVAAEEIASLVRRRADGPDGGGAA